MLMVCFTVIVAVQKRHQEVVDLINAAAAAAAAADVFAMVMMQASRGLSGHHSVQELIRTTRLLPPDTSTSMRC